LYAVASAPLALLGTDNDPGARARNGRDAQPAVRDTRAMMRLASVLALCMAACGGAPASVGAPASPSGAAVTSVPVQVPAPAPAPAPPIAETPLAAPTTPAPETAAATETSIADETPENLGLATLRQYYADLNNRTFEASKYFAAGVKQYITMQNPKPSAIDHYMREIFPKQFESYEFLFDESTVQADGPKALKYLERWRAYVVRKREFQMTLAEVRVEFDLTGKIVDFRYGKVLSRETTPEIQGD
jgi:hypothetical protein